MRFGPTLPSAATVRDDEHHGADIGEEAQSLELDFAPYDPDALADRHRDDILQAQATPRVRALAEATLAPRESPVFNTIARIDGSEKPSEYVMLSAHLDSWDAGSGATDNGTGTITMLEAMRILKTAYPRPKRTILVGHWSGEEEGDIGSGAFAAAR